MAGTRGEMLVGLSKKKKSSLGQNIARPDFTDAMEKCQRFLEKIQTEEQIRNMDEDELSKLGSNWTICS